MTSAPAQDFGLLQRQPGQSSLVGKLESFDGYLHLRITDEGICAVLSGGTSTVNNLRGFLWPRGYRAVNRERGMQVLDGRGRWVASDGDFLYTRGILVNPTDLSAQVQQRCPHRSGGEYVIDQVSTPGTPLGSAKRRPVILDCQGLPLIKPTQLMLGCSGGWYLDHIRYDAWNREGVMGTAIAQVVCPSSPDVDRVPARFTYQHVRPYHRLLTYHGPRIDYMQEPCKSG